MNIQKEADMAHDVFISYSSKDKLVADNICENLEAAGVRCWIAPRDIAPGEDWPTSIAKAIPQSHVMILVFSASSNSSEDVGRELFLAANNKLVIVPFKIGNFEPEPGKQYYLARTHWLEATDPPMQKQLRALVECVKGLIPVREPSQESIVQPAPPSFIDRPSPGNKSPQPPLKTSNRASNNLPVQLTSFIGREKEITEVKQLLNAKRLVTITGPGGTGKTRLSLQVGSNLVNAFPNGVWLVELAPVVDPELVSQAAASALGVHVQRDQSVIDALTDFLREKDLLLILDNCEHLVDACAKLADSLLHLSPCLKILASSREALGIDGEVPFRLPSLSTPDMRNLPSTQTLLQYEAVRLFIERATTALATFTVTDDNAPALAQICHRLDGIPLAIELAAARVRMLSVEQIADRLDDCFRLLTGGSRTALPRLQTLRALIDWSYNLLSTSERTLLRCLSVFMGGWTLEALETVCASAEVEQQVKPSEILDILTSLINKSLVSVEHEQDQEPRYRLLETIRQYALEKLAESGEGESIRNQHLGYFMSLAERAEPEFHGAEQRAWFDRMEFEHDNFRAALRWSLENGNVRAELGLRVASSLWWFWFIRGYSIEGYDWLERTLTESASRTPVDLATRAKALTRIGYFQSQLSVHFEEGLELARTLGPTGKKSMAIALWSRGTWANYQADYVGSIALEEEGLKLFRELGNHWGICETLTWMGSSFSSLGDHQKAEQFLMESLMLARQVRDSNEIAWALWQLGNVAIARKDFEQATVFLEESLALYKEMKNPFGFTWVLGALGNANLEKGDYSQAISRYKEQLALYWERGNERQTAEGLGELAGAATFAKHPEQAAILFGAAESLRESSEETMFPYQRPWYESFLKALHPQLDKDRLTVLWAEGRAMTAKQAVAYAMKEKLA